MFQNAQLLMCITHMPLLVAHLCSSLGCASKDGCSSRVCQCLNWNQVSLAGLGLLGQREVTEGDHGGPHACTVLEAPVANTFPFVTQSHVRQGKENCYFRELLHLNHAIFY